MKCFDSNLPSEYKHSSRISSHHFGSSTQATSRNAMNSPLNRLSANSPVGVVKSPRLYETLVDTNKKKYKKRQFSNSKSQKKKNVILDKKFKSNVLPSNKRGISDGSSVIILSENGSSSMSSKK